MRAFKNKYLLLALRVLLGAMFVYASLDKVANPHAFAINVRAYQIIPVSLSNLFALVLAWSELVAGALLILGLFTRKAAATVFMLLVMFIAALTTVLVKGMVIDCGCFKSDGGSTVQPLLIARNVVSAVAAFLLIRFDEGFFGLAGLFRRNS